MSRYQLPGGSQAQAQPGSHGRVLRNLRGITRMNVMHAAEHAALVEQQFRYYYELVGAETSFTASLLCAMHRDWLGRIYDWAGEYRRVEVSKGGFRWPSARYVPEAMEAFERALLRRHTPCPPEPVAATARRLAEVHAELLFIHPFREGNGRLARWLADVMALQAGHPLPDYQLAGRGSRRRGQEYLFAVTEGYKRNYDLLTAFFARAIERRLRV